MTNTNGNGAALTSNADPFSPEALRLSQDFVGLVGVKKELTTLPVRKPNKQSWFRVHPAPEYRLSPLGVINLKDDNECYVVTPALATALANEMTNVTLYTVVDRFGVASLWPVPLPPTEGKDNSWWASARDAAERAMHTWTRIVPNRALGAYDVFQAPPGMPEPEFPDGKTLGDLLKIALGTGYLVNSLDHPVVKRLRGIV